MAEKTTGTETDLAHGLKAEAKQAEGALTGAAHDAEHAAHDHADHAHDAAHAHEAKAHEGDHGHADAYGPALGRYIEHPPEPPHFLQIWYKNEQKALQKAWQKDHPGAPAPKVVENWLKKDEVTGKWVEVEGQKPTVAQVLHAGTLKEPLPLIGYAPWENHVFMAIASVFLVGFFFVGTMGLRADRKKAMKSPGRMQAMIEMIVSAFDDFCKGVLGEENGRRYMPFIATLFMMILTMNLMGLVPVMKAPTSSILITFSLALCSFIVVQSTAWVRLGPLNYIHHLMGSPKDAIGWGLSPLFLILECISDFVAKPMSLALRLMGNILGKDILLGAFLGMGISLVSVINHDLGEYVGLPLTFPFYFLGLLLSTIQALVFSLLTMIYITMVLPHDHDHHDDHGHAGEHGHDGHGHHDHHQKKAVHEAVPA